MATSAPWRDLLRHPVLVRFLARAFFDGGFPWPLGPGGEEDGFPSPGRLVSGDASGESIA